MLGYLFYYLYLFVLLYVVVRVYDRLKNEIKSIYMDYFKKGNIQLNNKTIIKNCKEVNNLKNKKEIEYDYVKKLINKCLIDDLECQEILTDQSISTYANKYNVSIYDKEKDLCYRAIVIKNKNQIDKITFLEGIKKDFIRNKNKMKIKQNYSQLAMNWFKEHQSTISKLSIKKIQQLVEEGKEYNSYSFDLSNKILPKDSNIWEYIGEVLIQENYISSYQVKNKKIELFIE